MTRATRISSPARSSDTTQSSPLVSIAIFSTLGLLISLLAIMGGQFQIGDWF